MNNRDDDRVSTIKTLSKSEKVKLLALAKAKGLKRKNAGDAQPIQPAARSPQGEPLAFAQRRLWFLAQMEENASGVYTLGGAFTLTGRLDACALRVALDRLVDRHEILRTRFVTVEGTPLQQIDAADIGFTLEEIDGSDIEAAEHAFPPHFDLEKGPLIVGQLVRMENEVHLLRIAMHHIIADGWSIGLFMRELGMLYQAFSTGLPDPLPPLDIQYADYAVWQHRYLHGEVLQAQQRYWVEQLQGIPACLTLPTDRPRPQTQDYAGGSIPVMFDSVLLAELNALSRRHGCTLFMTLLAGWSLLMSRLSGQDEVVIGTPIAGRGRREVESLIGMFVNTQALRVDLSASPDTGALLEQVKAAALAAQSHADIPFEQVVEAVAPVRSLSHSPIFQVMLALQNTPDNKLSLPGLTLSELAGEAVNAPFDLSLSLGESNGVMQGVLIYATALFDENTVQRYLGYWQALLRSMAESPHLPVQALPMLSFEERQKVVFDFNDTLMDYPAESCIHELFEQQVKACPDEVALVYDDQTLCYGELNARANQLAHWLIELGVRPDDRVAIALTRGVEMVVAILATLKAGGAYVPLDPLTPPARLAYTLEDSKPLVLITMQDIHAQLGDLPQALKIIELDSDYRPWSACAVSNIPPVSRGVTSRHLAYVIYTSGSTGKPKGVMVPHQGVVNFLLSQQRQLGVKAAARLLAVTTVSFDIHVLEIYLPLICCGQLHVASDALRQDGERLGRYLCEQGITLFQATPATWKLLLESGWHGEPGLTALIGGESFPLGLAQALLEKVGNLWNMYGPTETTVWSTCSPILSADQQIVIGRPLANTQIYMLDSRGEPAPIGVAGEICIGGAGVTRGYLGREDLTAERFVDDPFSGEPGARLYRTGDLGRWRADGTIDYLGRNDFQVKIRGFRIELGEIESALQDCGAVREAVVTASGSEEQEKRLVAYCVPREEGGIAIEALKEHLSERLPAYMVPAAYVMLARIPLTANGKVDRKALPEPDEAAFVRQRYEAPLAGDETALAAMWQALLGVEKVSRQDDFFALGGHSLLAVQLISRIRSELNRELPLAELFARPALKDMAAALGTAGKGALSAIEPLAAGETPPLSLAQQRLWFLAQMDEAAGAAYVIAGGFRLCGKLDVAALRQALDRIVARHAALRTHIESREGAPVQVVGPAGCGFPLRLRDAAGVGTPAPFAPVFDLTRGPLAQGELVRISDDEHWLRLALHHVIADGWSVGVLMRELGTLYQAFSAGGPDPLPPLAIQYGDYAAWQHRHVQAEMLQAQQRYWVEQLRGIPACLTLPTDRPRPPVQRYAGAHIEAKLDRELTDRLKTLSRRHGCTLFMTLLAGWSLLMSRLSGQDEVVIGTPVAGRGRREIESLIGMFVNTQALRVDLSASPDSGALLAQVKTAALEAQSHADIPFEQVVEAVAPARSLSYSPLFQVMLALQNTPDNALRLPALTLSPLANAATTAQFDLSLSLSEDNGAVQGVLIYATALFDEGTVRRYLGYWQALLRGMVDNADQPVQSLPMLPEAERRQVLVEFNQTRTDSPDEVCLHALFEAQAARHQDAVALCCDGQTLRYGELNARANQLAHWLYELGVRPDSRVALVLERGVDLIVAMLATLKAGGAYVPLDPSYPQERLRYMLDDSDPTVVLTSRALRGQLGALPAGLRTIELDGDSRPWTQCPAVNRSPARLGLTQNHLAYVIYTSGSSGQPKGVMVAHRGVVNLVRWHCDAFALRESHCASSVAGLGFDAAVWEIWPPLCVGARLVMPGPAVSRDPEQLLAWWMSQPIDVGFLPTPVAELAFARELHHPTLRTLLVGGDRLNRRAPDNAGFTLVNNYGPTENSVVATSGAVCADDRVLHIGRPIANTALYILDPQGEPVPVGVCGELYIGGAQVARGYLNRPELTAERFLDDPFAGEGERMYRTGDLGRWLSDGRVEFMGRNDFQVKIRGFRIELGEIESALLACDGVCESVVVAQGEATQEKRLVAYYTVHDTAQIPGAEALKAQLGARLPAYMVPAAYVMLARIPLTANGKVDRKALPEPDEAAFVRQRYEAPLAGDETALAAMWQALLGVEKVSRQDDFFALGGHSLLAVQLISRIRSELNRELPLAELFARPALKDMAAALGTAGKGALSAIEPLAAGETPPLSLAQQRLWFLAQMDEAAGAAYVIAGGFRLCGKLDVAALRQALDRIVARHAALRTHIESREGAPVQVVGPAGCGFPLRLRDAAGVGTPAPFALVFDLTRGPLAQGELVRISDDEHWLRLALHHVIADGWSVGVLMRELGTLYQAFSAGGPDPLPPLAIQYGDYAAWQHRHVQAEMLQAQQRYWVEQLRGIPACLTLPTDRPRPPVQRYAGAHIEARLDRELTDRLKTLSRRHGCTLFMTLLAGWSLLMSRLSGQDEVVIGTPVAGRGRREIESLIGMFVNTQALRVDLSASPDSGALLAQVKTAALEAQSHADIPFEQVVEAVAPARSLSYSPLFQVMFTLQNMPDSTAELDGVTLSSLSVETTTSQCDLSLELYEREGQIGGRLQYATALFDEGTVRRYLGYWQALLRGMADNADQPIRSLPMLPEAERRQVLIDFNQTSADYPSTACIHSLFEAQAKANPDALALIDGDRRLSYGELNRQADRLACWLAERGVRRESRVAIALERGVDLIMAILSTLKAGGAYVPLDPSYPQERLHFIVADSTPQVLITNTPSRAAFSTLPAELIVLDVDIVRPWDDADSDADEMPTSAAVNASTLAYIMYTSGSTGRPKGVMVQHGNVVKLALNNGYADFRADDRIACLANPAFDASTMELWGALLNGGSIAIFSRDTVLDARLFGAQLREQRVSMLFMTTALFNQYAHALQDYLPSLRYLLVGGESLDLGFIRHTLRHGAPQNFMHVYGPTETTTFATAYRMNETDPDRPCMPIGRPIANTVVYLLDEHKQPVPIGVTGEVYIGGSGVARGYLNLPEQTAERFLSDPFAVEVGARMYRTGDLARWRVDGTLEFQGRNDFQVKIRGFRIELGEIESALQACNGVTQAVVAARNSGADKQLVAYYTAGDGAEICAGELKAQLGARLPAYMVPAAYVKLETIPLTANGKVDHKALPTPDEYALARGDYEAPQGREEQILAVIWQNLLGVEQVSRHDDFFALGGHSLLAVRFINEARKQEIYLTLSSLFAAPQLRLLAEKIQRGDAQNVHERAVAFRASGSQRPLFIVPEASAEMLYGPLLASCIDSDIPVYGLMGPDRNLPTFKTLEGAAARYVGIIRSTQPQGPYRLLGWSFGGTLAYEIAAQLLGQDQQIEFLGMLDTRLPERGDGHIVPMDELFALSDDEAMIDFLIRGDIEAIVGADCLERAGRPVSWQEHYQLGQKMGMLPAGWSPDYYQNWIRHRLDLLRVKYHVPTLPVNLDLFIARDEPNDGGQYLGWDRVLPCEAIRLFSLHGEHRMLVSEPYVRETGKMVSEAIQARSKGRITVPDARDDGHEPIVPLQTGERNSPTLLCVHGAGDNVFAFIDLVKSVASDWTILGLQARGLWGEDVPHSSVETAAEHYFQALRRQTLSGPLYLLGHSFGGWVALELATKLEAEGIAVESLVLADSDAPTGDAREYTDLQALIELVELFEMQGYRLGLDAASLDGMTHSQRLVALHRSLMAQGLMPESTRLSVVEGIFRVFSANIRTRYAPARLPAVTPYLIQACDADNEQLEGWQTLFPQLRYARSEGNHTQLLKSPCSALLVEALLQK